VLVAEVRSAQQCGSDTVSTRCGRPDLAAGLQGSNIWPEAIVTTSIVYSDQNR
jgi:hypothetical protein